MGMKNAAKYASVDCCHELEMSRVRVLRLADKDKGAALASTYKVK